MILIKVKYDNDWLPPMQYKNKQQAIIKYNKLIAAGHIVEYIDNEQ